MAKFSSSHIASGLIIPLLVLVIGVGGYFVLLPKYRSAQEKQAELATKEAQMQERESQVSQIQDLIRELASKQSEIAPIDEALPAAPRIPELLANLEFLAQQSGLTVGGINLTLLPPSELSPAGVLPGLASSRFATLISNSRNLAIIKIDMPLSGQYENFKAFLTNVEQNLRLMDIQSTVLGSSSEGSATQEYSFEILTYYQTE